MDNYWVIEIWVNPEDQKSKMERDLLKEIRRKDKNILFSLEEKMNTYVQSPIEGLVKLGDLEKIKARENMWELKFHLKNSNEIRFLGCLSQIKSSHVYYALYGFRKKDQKIKSHHLEIAKGRIKEFKFYYKENELQKLL